MDIIFEKAKNEFFQMFPDFHNNKEERDEFLSNFDLLLGQEWIKEIQEDTESNQVLIEDLQNSDYNYVIFSFFYEQQYKSLEKQLWQYIIASCSNQYPFLSFSLLIVADKLFSKKSQLDNFYSCPEKDQLKNLNSHEIFFYNLIKLENDDLNYSYQALKNHLPLKKNKGYSSQLVEITENLYKYLCSTPKKNQDTKNNNSEKNQIQCKESYKDEDLTQNQDKLSNNEIFYNLLSDKQKNIYQDINEGLDSKLIEKNFTCIDQPSSWRDQFLKNLLILYWKKRTGQKDELLFILRSLWQTVRLLGSRNKTNNAKQPINIENPQDIILALWEPQLYIILVQCTIQILKNYKDLILKVGDFEFNHEVISQLRCHQYKLGIYSNFSLK